MRVPGPALRKRLLPERVLQDAYPHVVSYAGSVADMFAHLPLEDVEEAALLGAWLAWETFDPQNAAWSTWLRRNVNWTIAEAARNWGKDRQKAREEFRKTYQVLSLNEAAGLETELTLDEVVPDRKAEFTAEADERAILREVLGAMLPRERQIFVGRYLLGRLKCEIAEEMGISPSRVSQLEASGRQRALEAFQPLTWAATSSVSWEARDGRGAIWVIRRRVRARLPYRVFRTGTDTGEQFASRPAASAWVAERAQHPLHALARTALARLHAEEDERQTSETERRARRAADLRVRRALDAFSAFSWRACSSVSWEAREPDGTAWTVRRTVRTERPYRVLTAGAETGQQFPTRGAALHWAETTARQRAEAAARAEPVPSPVPEGKLPIPVRGAPADRRHRTAFQQLEQAALPLDVDEVSYRDLAREKLPLEFTRLG